MKMIKWLNSAFDRGVIKQVFDHVRNFMICAFILAIGTTELRQTEASFFGLIAPGYGGLGVITAGIGLICFNLYDGIRRISRSKHHSILVAVLVLLYLFFSIRVVEMAWNFRDMGTGLKL